MTIINDLGNGISQLNRVYNLEVNIPYNGGSNLLFRNEQLTLLDNNILSQTQIPPKIIKYSDIATSTITIYDPITSCNTTISVVALIAALQQLAN